MLNADWYHRLVTVVRLLLGAEFTVNGLNWWIKMITPYPSISDDVARLPHGDFVAALISTGILFHLVKGLELLAGLALLTNYFVPLALVSVFAVTVNVFITDVFLQHRLRGFVMGSGAMLMNLFLMFAYLERYRPLLVPRVVPDALDAPALPDAGSATNSWLRTARLLLAVLSALVGVIMISWITVMIAQHFLSGR